MLLVEGVSGEWFPINIIQRVSGRTGSLAETYIPGTGSLQNPLDRTRIAGGSHADRTHPDPLFGLLVAIWAKSQPGRRFIWPTDQCAK